MGLPAAAPPPAAHSEASATWWGRISFLGKFAALLTVILALEVYAPGWSLSSTSLKGALLGDVQARPAPGAASRERFVLNATHGSQRVVPGSQVISFNAITTTMGTRDTLARALQSAASQLSPVDYLTVISENREKHAEVSAILQRTPCNCTKVLIENPKPGGFWGHLTLNTWLPVMPGAYLMFFDDDDLYVPDAFDIVRHYVTSLEPHLYIFRLVRFWDGAAGLIPPVGMEEGRDFKPHWISKQNGVIPNVPGLPKLGYHYLGDAEFYVALRELLGADKVTIVNEVIYQMGQTWDGMAVVPSLMPPGWQHWRDRPHRAQ